MCFGKQAPGESWGFLNGNMRECKHPTCGDTCRREKKPKKIYYLKRSPIKKKVPANKKGYESLPHGQLLQLAQMVFNKWIRRRDLKKLCISFGKQVEDAGHYYPAGKYSGVRFDEINVNGQSRLDNQMDEGSLQAYRIGLIQRHGTAVVYALDERARLTMFYKWSRAELVEIIEKYKV